MGNEPILALPEGADDFIVYYDARSKDLKACLEKGRRVLRVCSESNLYMDHECNQHNTLSIGRIEHEAKMMDGCYLVSLIIEAKYHLGKANVDVVPWSRKKE
ncbi:hypothetical protein Tco_0918994 [Tanacetum coccineum]